MIYSATDQVVLSQGTAGTSCRIPDPKVNLENKIAVDPRFWTSFESELPVVGFHVPCKGSLMSVCDTSYRCLVGHTWSPDVDSDAEDAG